MLHHKLSILATLPLLLSLGGSHGKLTWFEGSYEELLTTAAKSNRPIFLDFYTDSCAPCRLMDGQTFSDPKVVELMSEFLCFAADGNLTDLQELSKTMRVTMFPSLIFLDKDGQPLDKFEGFQPPRAFAREVERIKRNEGTIPGLRTKIAKTPTDVIAHLDLALKEMSFGRGQQAQQAHGGAVRLVQSNTGFDPSNLEERFAIAIRFRDLGDAAQWNQQIKAILALDPERKSRPVRRLSFDQALAQVSSSMNDTDLRTLMQTETDHEMLHEGWHAISTAENYRAQKAKMKRKKEEAAAYRKQRRHAIRQAFLYTNPTQSLTYGIFVAQLHLDELADLSDEEKPAVLEVARKIATDANADTGCLDLFAQWLALTGDRAKALEIAKRCVELEPGRMRWRGRVAELEEEQ